MKDKTITRKISQGMYVLTTIGGGCIVDAVSQISAGDNPLISVAVMKNNFTNELMKKSDRFAISILGIGVNPSIIETYGMKSMKEYDKFANSQTLLIDNLHIIEDSLGYMICEKIDEIDNDTHTLFIGRLVKADKFNAEEAMTYSYYQEHKGELMKVITSNGKTAWICQICNYVVYEDDLPEGYICPKCSAPKDLFVKKEG